MKQMLFTVVTAGFFSLLSGCGANTSSQSATESALTSENNGIRVLTIGTADSGGTMYPVGSAIANVISSYEENIKINLSASNGSLTNVQGLVGGQFDLGLVSGDIAFSAYFGTEEFEDQPVTNLRTIGAVYTSLSNWMAPESENLYYVHELAGRRIAIGPQESSTELAARIALRAAGINDENSTLGNYGLGSGSIEVQRGNMDAVHGFAGIPITGLTALANAVPSRLLKYTPEELRAIIAANSFYYKEVIPAGTYLGQTEDIETFGIKCLLCVTDDMDEELVYAITKILDESRPQLAERHESLLCLNQRDFMCSDLSIPLHPGAERYYIEKGYMEQP